MENLEVRRTDFDDVKDLTDLITKTGGLSIYKATFGAYNLSAMIENSYLSLMSANKFLNNEGVEEKETISFISLNDGLTLVNDPDAYAKIINALSHYIPATVRRYS